GAQRHARDGDTRHMGLQAVEAVAHRGEPIGPGGPGEALEVGPVAGEAHGADWKTTRGERFPEGTHLLGSGRQAVDEKAAEGTRAAQREAAASLQNHAPLAAGGRVVPHLERTLAG